MDTRQVPITAFIETFSASLCESAASQLRPIFRPEHRIQAQPILNRLKEPLWPPQADVAAATALVLQQHRGALIVGEMATGKTRTSVGACLIHGSRRVLVMVPPHLLRKWEREIKRVLPDAAVHQLKSLSSIDLVARAPLLNNRPLFAIISREKAKLSYATKPALVLRRWKNEHGLLDRFCCPHCGAEVRDADDTPLTPKTLPAKSTCRACRSPLYDFDPNGPRRYSLADYICKKHPTLFDTLVVDEVHELKGKATAQGIAFANLMKVTDRVIALTGTLSNGRSTSLFYLLWRLIPGLKSAYRFHDESRWVDVYGVRETRTTSIDVDQVVEQGTQSKRKVYVTILERPGISPRLIPQLVDKACFLRMEDLDIALPPYEEHVETCQLEGQLKEQYEQLLKAAKPLIREARKSRDGHLLSTVVQALVAYPDRCTNEERITNKFGEVKLALPPLPELVRYPKERLLLQQVEDNLNRHRRVLVYCTHTGTRDITPRLHLILKQAGFRTAVLTASVQAERREEWIEDRVKAGLDVLICNPRLVQTGLDLLDFPSLRFFESDYNILTVRQAARRSWRPGQQHPVDVRPLMYAGTAQERAWSLIASGIKASLYTEGDITSQAMAAFNQEDDITIGLIRFILDQNPELMSAEKAFRDLARAYKDQREVIGASPAQSPFHHVATAPAGEQAVIIATTEPAPAKLPDLSTQLALFAA
ncbi:MAG: helicase-related protein [Nitrospiraceae bacterium]